MQQKRKREGEGEEGSVRLQKKGKMEETEQQRWEVRKLMEDDRILVVLKPQGLPVCFSVDLLLLPSCFNFSFLTLFSRPKGQKLAFKNVMIYFSLGHARSQPPPPPSPETSPL